MLTIIDRYVLRSLIVNYLIGLGTMLSLYVVLDMFVNMDEFTEHGYPAARVIGNVISYYWPNLFLYFAQLSAVITLFAAMATVARMRKLNELTAVLASGVSLYRLAAPIVAFAVLTTGLLVMDTEWVIPAVAHKLARDHDDVDGRRTYEVLFLHDREGALLSAGRFEPRSGDLRRLLVLFRDESGRVVRTLEADRATWEPATTVRPDGRWRLQRGRLTARRRLEETGLGPQGATVVTHPAYYPSDLSPQAIQLRQSEAWISFLSLGQLRALEARGGATRLAAIQTRHARLTAPLIGLVMLLLGLPFFLDRTPANVLSDAGRCTIACGLCYVSAVVAQTIRPESATALPLWIPIFVFGTLAIVLLDRIHT